MCFRLPLLIPWGELDPHFKDPQDADPSPHPPPKRLCVSPSLDKNQTSELSLVLGVGKGEGLPRQQGRSTVEQQVGPGGV